MSDERFKLGFKKYLQAVEQGGYQKRDFPIGERLVQETRRLQKCLFPLLLVIGVRLIIDSFLDDVVYTAQAGWMSAGCTVAMGILCIIFLIMAVTAKNKIPVHHDLVVAYWAFYLKKRLRTFWMIYLAILFGTVALTLITYDQTNSLILKIVMGLIVLFAGTFLARSYLYADYKFCLKEAEQHLMR